MVRKILHSFLVLTLIIGWIFSGWPQVWQNPSFPPEIQKALAATATVVPTGDSVTASWTTTPLWSKVDDDIDSPDATVINSPSAPGASEAITFTITCPADTDTVTAANLRIRTRDSNGGARTLTATVAWSATAATNVSVPDLPGTMTNYASGNQTGLSISKATCNASTITVTPNSTGGGKPKIMEVEAINLDITYTAVTISAPTITLSPASSVEATTATLNGNVTNTGNENPTVTVYWGTSDGGQTPGSWDNSSAPTSPSQPQDVAAFTRNVTGLSAGTTIYFSAKATNSGGTGWPASSLSFLTKPAAPTGVSATDGTATDKVTITWTKSTGATDYHVWRDSTDLGSAGDVATFDDTGADAPTITAGSTVASDGTSADHVALSLSGTSANNGTTHTYKVVASNATGDSADSATDTGYRGVGSLTYQWQRSAADSDASYSNISGATSATHNDTGAPANGDGRYYQCILNATGAAQQTSASDRGFRQAVYSVSITTNGTIEYGFVEVGTASSTLNNGYTQTAENDGNTTARINVRSSDATGGTTWTLNTAIGTNQFAHEFSTTSGAVWTNMPDNATYVLADPSVAVSGTVNLDFRFTAPDDSSDYQQKSITITVQAAAP